MQPGIFFVIYFESVCCNLVLFFCKKGYSAEKLIFKYGQFGVRTCREGYKTIFVNISVLNALICAGLR